MTIQDGVREIDLVAGVNQAQWELVHLN